jgi:hypothetical protein
MSQRHMMIDANKDFDSEEQHLLMDTPRHGQNIMMATPAVSSFIFYFLNKYS